MMSGATLYSPPRPPVPREEHGWFGILKTLRGNAIQMWPQAAYEKEILVSRFFGRQRVLLNTPEAIHHVLVDNAANYRRSPASVRILRPIVGRGLFLSEGDDWKHQRRTIAPSLAPRVMPMLARHVVLAAQDAVERLAALAGQPIDLLAAMQVLALEIAGRSMFSLEMRQQGVALRTMITDFGLRLGKPYLFDMLLPPSVPTLRDLARHRFRRRWEKFMDSIIADRLAETAPEVPRDLLDILRAARDPETGEAFSREQLRDQISTLIVAGHETTALALFWSLYLLANAPAEQQRLADEVSAVDINADSSFEALQRLSYARAVVSEGLRLFPPAFVLVRQAIGDDRWQDIAFPGGSLVLISPWVLHHHRRHWTNPDAFDPSRFLESAPAIPRLAYLPFGAGPRVCVGAQFALTEAALVLALMLKRFDVRLAETGPVYPMAVVTTQPDHHALFLLRSRTR